MKSLDISESKLVFRQRPGAEAEIEIRRFNVHVSNVQAAVKILRGEMVEEKAKCIISIATYCTVRSISFLPHGYAAVQL